MDLVKFKYVWLFHYIMELLRRKLYQVVTVGHVKVQQGRRGLKLEVYSLLSSLQFMLPMFCMGLQNGSLFSASHILLIVYSAR